MTEKRDGQGPEEGVRAPLKEGCARKLKTLAQHTRFARWVKVLGYLSIYPDITTKELAQKLGLSRSRASRVLNEMKEHGFIIKEFRSFVNKWTPTEKGVRFFKGSLKSSTSKSSFNYHDLQVKLPILSRPERFDDVLVNQGFEVATRRHYKGHQRRLAQGTVLITPKSVLFYPSEIWGESPDECAAALVQVAQALRIRLEEEFQGLRLGYPEGWGAGFKLTRQHMSLVGGPSDLIPEGFSDRADDRLVVEASKTPEFETIHPKLAFEDMAALVEFNRSVIKNGVTGEGLAATLELARANTVAIRELAETTKVNAQEIRLLTDNMSQLIVLLTTVLGVSDENALKGGGSQDAPDNTGTEGGSVGYG